MGAKEQLKKWVERELLRLRREKQLLRSFLGSVLEKEAEEVGNYFADKTLRQFLEEAKQQRRGGK